MAAAAGNVKSVSLELGGNDAAVVLDDADFDAIMPALCRGIFMRAGQICLAVKRVYVPRSRFDELVEKMCQIVDAYQVGYGLDERTTFGPVINADALRRLEHLLERTRAAGATVRELGKKIDPSAWDKGYYMLPQVVTDVAPDAELVQVEQFGPVVPLVAYDDVDEAVAMANGTEYGLCSSVWSTDEQRALGVARRFEAGVTFVNGHGLQYLSFDMPLGGVKQSGLGRERAALGIEEYVEEHVIRVAK
jgi:aldehyde dehydrogenase